MEMVNGLSLPVVLLMGLVGAPVLLRRAGYPMGKTILGTLTGAMVLLGCWAILSSIQNRLGLTFLPLGWLVPLASGFAVWRWRGQL
ncbi:hypothetical protein [Magnetospirillum aberrantis]|uniref:Uncharacterized protein n=1 Tax=Magnetospirillum aberrantis SpK TaxID=908842 RepID=A0A7C9QW39_9PROT|nr:hypothetical protein [Magnetospirillum aberrantis]NFV82063.1 hypothetical protein [Magnetospirillum aberrantis SpK]